LSIGVDGIYMGLTQMDSTGWKIFFGRGLQVSAKWLIQ